MADDLETAKANVPMLAVEDVSEYITAVLERSAETEVSYLLLADTGCGGSHVFGNISDEDENELLRRYLTAKREAVREAQELDAKILAMLERSFPGAEIKAQRFEHGTAVMVSASATDLADGLPGVLAGLSAAFGGDSNGESAEADTAAATD
jgi:hypothetical protein